MVWKHLDTARRANRFVEGHAGLRAQNLVKGTPC